ncbi:hypothetical protein ABK040_000589 [Willaertia magna]
MKRVISRTTNFLLSNNKNNNTKKLIGIPTIKKNLSSSFNKLIKYNYHSSNYLKNLFIRTQETPNPSSIKFLPGFPVLDEKEYPNISTVEIKTPLESYKSPLAKLLFKIDGVKSVFLTREFVTITIENSDNWHLTKLHIFTALNNFYESGRPVLDEDAQPNKDTQVQEGDDEVIVAIKEILETRIRPMVQEDGGDVIFSRFDENTGTVYLKLQGSCATCPSSTATLKGGIENMLMHYVAEVESVEEEITEEDKVSDEQFKKTEAEINAKKQQVVDAYTA